MLSSMEIWTAADARALVAPLVRVFVIGLARPPTPGEIAPLVRHLRAGGDIGDAAQEVAAGPEFISRHGPDAPPGYYYVRSLFWAIDGQGPARG